MMTSTSPLPLLTCLSPALLFLLHLSNVATAQGASWEDYKYGLRSSALHDETHSCSWKCILFTLQWPGGFCQSLDNGTLCRIPPNVNNWTIHGLWPVRALSCCDCWPMFHSDVQELEDELTENWPSLLKTKSSFQFWKDEWRKHGACAACVEGLNSPLRYFQICLKLQQQFHIQRLLEDVGITPSCERPYKVDEVRSVLAPHLGDDHQIQCVPDDQGRHVWFQVKIQLSRRMTVGCDNEGHPAVRSSPGSSTSPGYPCPAHFPFYYIPINHQDPHRPCG